MIYKFLWNYYTTNKDILILDQSKFSILIRLSQLFTEHKGWESRAICGLSHDPVIRVRLCFSRLEMFHNLFHDTSSREC